MYPPGVFSVSAKRNGAKPPLRPKPFTVIQERFDFPMKNLPAEASLFELIIPIAKAVDIMCPQVASHHMQVAYLSLRIAESLGMSETELHRLVIAGALHDIGAFSMQTRLDILAFEDLNPGQHAQAGYLLLRDFSPLRPMAELIRFHHQPWLHGDGALSQGIRVDRGSHILHLADRVAVLIDRGKPILAQVAAISEKIAANSGSFFVPEQVQAMLSLAKKDYIWLEVISDSIASLLKTRLRRQKMALRGGNLQGFGKLMSRIIDFKSKFTAFHSSGVAAISVALARAAGFSEKELGLLESAAYLHDLGKLAIPSEIIEKKGKLTADEWFIMRSHAYYTHKVLDEIDIFRAINTWASLHQERLDGSGYPFGRKNGEIPLGARIITIADIFTALTEDRPYRSGMGAEEVAEIFSGLVAEKKIDRGLVALLVENFAELNRVRQEAQQRAVKEYADFTQLLEAAVG